MLFCKDHSSFFRVFLKCILAIIQDNKLLLNWLPHLSFHHAVTVHYHSHTFLSVCFCTVNVYSMTNIRVLSNRGQDVFLPKQMKLSDLMCRPCQWVHSVFFFFFCWAQNGDTQNKPWASQQKKMCSNLNHTCCLLRWDFSKFWTGANYLDCVMHQGRVSCGCPMLRGGERALCNVVAWDGKVQQPDRGPPHCVLRAAVAADWPCHNVPTHYLPSPTHTHVFCLLIPQPQPDPHSSLEEGATALSVPTVSCPWWTRATIWTFWMQSLHQQFFFSVTSFTPFSSCVGEDMVLGGRFCVLWQRALTHILAA